MHTTSVGGTVRPIAAWVTPRRKLPSHSGGATWLLPWLLLRRSPDVSSTVSRDVVKCLDTRRTAVRDQRRWDPSRAIGEQGGGTAASRIGVQLNGGDDLSTRDVIHLPRAQIEMTATRIAAEIIGGELSAWSDPFQVTVPWESPFSHLTERFAALFTPDFVQ
jgi:hypothetical protein